MFSYEKWQVLIFLQNKLEKKEEKGAIYLMTSQIPTLHVFTPL